MEHAELVKAKANEVFQAWGGLEAGLQRLSRLQQRLARHQLLAVLSKLESVGLADWSTYPKTPSILNLHRHGQLTELATAGPSEFRHANIVLCHLSVKIQYLQASLFHRALANLLPSQSEIDISSLKVAGLCLILNLVRDTCVLAKLTVGHKLAASADAVSSTHRNDSSRQKFSSAQDILQTGLTLVSNTVMRVEKATLQSE